MYICMHESVCVHVCGGTHAPWWACGSQRTSCGSWFSSSTTWVSRNKFRPSCSVASTLTHWVILDGDFNYWWFPNRLLEGDRNMGDLGDKSRLIRSSFLLTISCLCTLSCSASCHHEVNSCAPSLLYNDVLSHYISQETIKSNNQTEIVDRNQYFLSVDFSQVILLPQWKTNIIKPRA